MNCDPRQQLITFTTLATEIRRSSSTDKANRAMLEP